MHLLIVLLQQLLGMLSGAKKVLQPEAVRSAAQGSGTPNPNGSEPDACLRVAGSHDGWMTMISRAVSILGERAADLHSQRSSAKAGMRLGGVPGCRLSLRERTHTRGPRGD